MVHNLRLHDADVARTKHLHPASRMKLHLSLGNHDKAPAAGFGAVLFPQPCRQRLFRKRGRTLVLSSIEWQANRIAERALDARTDLALAPLLSRHPEPLLP